MWAVEVEYALKNSLNPHAVSTNNNNTFGALVTTHIRDLQELGRPLLRGKAMCLEKLKRDLGSERLIALTRERLIAYGKEWAQEGAGPVTLPIDFGYIRTILIHAAAVHGLSVPTEPVMLARAASRRLGLVGKGGGTHPPTNPGRARIIAYSEDKPRQIIPVGRLVKFAIATAMRQNEICSLLWDDVDLSSCIAIVRNRKDPRRKSGNDQRVPLLNVAGYDAITLLREQRSLRPKGDRGLSIQWQVARYRLSMRLPPAQD